MGEQIETDETARLIASDKVEGTPVFDRAGERLGTIRSFMVDRVSGQVEYATLSTGGGSHSLPWTRLSYDAGRGGYLVELDPGLTGDAPRFAANQEPVYDQTHGAQVHGYHAAPAPDPAA